MVPEAGVNGLNTTVMIIANAEDLDYHLCTSCVGRSSLQSYCVLESEMHTEVGVDLATLLEYTSA